ncbi:MAG: DNA repair protein RecO [Eubacteriales bacterium]|nr:DNA repair protein RecO [Eubacteriales bacterium]
MANSIVTGIVMRCTNYKESDRILSLFTEQEGRVDVKARGCRRPKSPLLACAQPFVYGEFTLFSGKGKFTLDSCDVKESFYPIREDVPRFTAASAMLALAADSVQPGEPNERLFSLLYHALSLLCYGDVDAIDLFLCYLLRYFDVTGYCPSITRCARCGRDLREQGGKLYFSAAQGGAVCGTCASGAKPASALALEAMRRMLLLSDRDMEKVKLNKSLQQELLTLLDSYASFVLERDFMPLESLKKLMP